MFMKILRKTLHIGGMSCVNCEHRIRYVLKTAPGIQDATVSYNTGLAHVTYDTDTISLKQIREIIEKNGYTILPETGTSDYDMKKKLCLTGCYPVLYALLQHFGILNLLAPGQLADTKMGYGMLFVIGLITSVHCIAMCGGINCPSVFHNLQMPLMFPEAAALLTFFFRLFFIIQAV